MGLWKNDIADEFERVHNSFIRTWDEAMNTGTTIEAEKLYGEEYFDTFLTRAHAQPSIENRDSAMEGMRSSVAALSGAVKRFENRLIRVRNTEDVVVFYEQVIEKDGAELARLFVIEDWALSHGAWRIVRETTEIV